MFPTIRSALPCCLLLAAHAVSAATVEVHVSGAAGARGKISIAVCDRERFLKQCAYSASLPAGGEETVLKVHGVPRGRWAILAYQDENENGILDRNLLGIPSENYGFSRDARGRFGPPSFDDAAIEVKEDPTVATVRLR
jgi:uncharacterized protein (DUF2141 family)